MKKIKKDKQKISKGAPSAVLLSILIHAGLFLGAGIFVVFTVLPKDEVKFNPPPPVKHPKIPLKKLQVKMKKPSKPKATAKLTAIVKKVDMKEIAFPDLPSSGMGTGIGGGADGVDFLDLPELEDVTIFGSGSSIGNDFTGIFYDLKRRQSGSHIAMNREDFLAAAGKFVRDGWKTTSLSRYHHADKKLYATCFMVPPILSALAPGAFGEPDVEGINWLVHYKGKLVYPEDIKFRFWGSSDDVLVVRVDGKIVLNACWPNTESYFSDWNYYPAGSRTYSMGNQTAVIGKWITLEAGMPLDMDVLIGEQPGGVFHAMLCVEVEGVKYPKNKFGGPILPMFKTNEPSLDLIDTIYYNLYPGEACVTNGPVFRDY